LFESEKSMLAFSRKDKKDFSVNNHLQNEKNIPLGPLYLVWNNLKNKQIKLEGANNWPYQIVGIELTQFSKKFPHMVPASSSPENVMQGFKAFQKYCMTCHKINGDGGDKGPDLTALPLPEESWLKKWIDNPASLRQTTMPALNPNVKNRKQTIDDIIAYLKAMKPPAKQ